MSEVKGTFPHNFKRAATGLVLGVSLCAGQAQAMGPVVGASATTLPAFYLLGIELGPWEDYLLRELTPDLSVVEAIPEPQVSWLDPEIAIELPVYARSLLSDDAPAPRLTLTFDQQLDNTLGSGPLAAMWRQQPLPGETSLDRQLLSPGLFQSVGDSSLVGVSAVLAYQRFSAPGMGYMARSQPGDPMVDTALLSPYEESTYGTGVRLALRSELMPRMAFDANYQSRIDMEEFNNYRGVYSEPGDLDIPAKAHVGVEFRTTESTSLVMGVDHVMYSDINAFPSRYLPERFVSLLGDSSSPVFAWDDLTVFSVGWRWQHREDLRFWVDLTTRQQPAPTSAVLDRALSSELADNAMLMGFSKQTSANAWLNITAAYASPEYAFGGSVLGVTSDKLDQSLELEALWVLNF